jgi:ribonuclease HI
MKHSTKAAPPRSARLFAEPHRPSPPAGVHLAYVDGASRGNPGPASYAVILRAPDGKELFKLGKPFGIATNNAAEYYALITALDYAAHHRIRSLRVRSDSELLVNQMLGRYRVRSKDLRPLHERAAKLANQLEYFFIEHVPREQNREADALANDALDRKGPVGDKEPARHQSEGVRIEGRPSKVESPKPRAGAPDSLLAPDHSPLPSRRIRARYVKGALVPAEPIHLVEGEEIEISVHKPQSR